jgi:Domain of unknown function (DUF4157)
MSAHQVLHDSPRLVVQRRQIAAAFGLPERLRAGVESLSGMDLSDVRVHANSSKPAQLNALAYTQGGDIYVAPGQERHLPHETWHVVQQAQGRCGLSWRRKDRWRHSAAGARYLQAG